MMKRYKSKEGIKTFQGAESLAVERKQLRALQKRAKKKKRTTGPKKRPRRKVNKRSVARGLKRLVGL